MKRDKGRWPICMKMNIARGTDKSKSKVHNIDSKVSIVYIANVMKEDNKSNLAKVKVIWGNLVPKNH